MIIKKLIILSLFCSVSCLAMDWIDVASKPKFSWFIKVGPKKKSFLTAEGKEILDILFKKGRKAFFNENFEELKDTMLSFFEKLNVEWQRQYSKNEKINRMVFAEQIEQQCPLCRLWIEYWKQLDNVAMSNEVCNSLLLQYVFDKAEHFRNDAFVGMIEKVIVESDDALLARNMITVPVSPLLYVLSAKHSYPWIFGVVRLLVESASDRDIEKIFFASYCGKTVFHIAAIYYDHRMADLLLENLTRALLAIGFENIQAILNKQDYSGLTPLHDACLRGNIAMVEWLLSHKVNVAMKARKMVTPLHCVMGTCFLRNEFGPVQIFLQPLNNLDNQAFYKQQIAQRKQIISLLAQHGADLKACDSYNYTAYNYARSNGHAELADYLSCFK